MNSRLFSQYRIDIQKLILIATPIGLAQLAQTGMGTVDVIMAGRVSSADVGGVGIGASICLLSPIVCVLLHSNPGRILEISIRI